GRRSLGAKPEHRSPGSTTRGNCRYHYRSDSYFPWLIHPLRDGNARIGSQTFRKLGLSVDGRATNTVAKKDLNRRSCLPISTFARRLTLKSGKLLLNCRSLTNPPDRCTYNRDC